MKILLINTGGTIACRATSMGLQPQLTAEELLEFLPKTTSICQIDALDLMSLESSDIAPRHWLNMVLAVESQYEAYDGFILCHGSDTMAYTAAALSYLIADSPKPIVLTGAQRPMEQPGSDGRKNLWDAIAYCTHPKACRVRLVFGGKVIAGTRAKKLYTHSDEAFCSVNFPLIATVHQGDVSIITEEEPPKHRCRFTHEMDPNVALLKLIPNSKEAEQLNGLIKHFHGIVLEGYGLGNLPLGNENAFLQTLNKATAHGVVLVGTSQAMMEGTHMERYAVGNLAKGCGILESYDMTAEAAVTKLMWLLGQSRNIESIIPYFYTAVDHDISLA